MYKRYTTQSIVIEILMVPQTAQYSNTTVRTELDSVQHTDATA
jgi:hypothetical protein